MTICIVTVYNSENCGSFLQAFALYDYLKKSGHTVYFLKRDTKGTSHSLKPHFEESIKRILKLKFKALIAEWQRYASFSEAQKIFPTISRDSAEYKSVDCFIIGSDTIWNLDNRYFTDNSKTYFGVNLGNKKIISYAASVANTAEQKFINNQTAAKGIAKMADISVRDISTYNVVKNIFGIESEIVCDPTLLLNKDEYNNLIKDKEPFPNSPILIYYFGNLPESTVKQIKALKNETGKKIISFGQVRKWCDINLPYDPYLFIQCYRDCSFVITNTYHGTIFSLIYEKNFADYGQNKKKVKFLLDSLGAENAFADDNDDLIIYYKNDLDYKVINKKIEEQKNISTEFLKRNLNI